MSFSEPKAPEFIPPPAAPVEDESGDEREAARQSRARERARTSTSDLRINPAISTGTRQGGGVAIPGSR